MEEEILKESKERLMSKLKSLMVEINSQKSPERTERDRLLAVAHTEAQKLFAFIFAWL